MKIQTSEVDRTDTRWHELDSFTFARNTATGVVLDCHNDSDGVNLVFVPGEAIAHCWIMSAHGCEELTVTFTRKLKLVKREFVCTDVTSFTCVAANSLRTLVSFGDSNCRLSPYLLADQTLPTPEDIVDHADKS